MEIAIDGSLIVNDVDLMLSAALDGVGIGYLPEPVVRPYLNSGRLVTFLEDWSSRRAGVFLYHPTKRQTPMPLLVFLKFLEERRRRLSVVR